MGQWDPPGARLPFPGRLLFLAEWGTFMRRRLGTACAALRFSVASPAAVQAQRCQHLVSRRLELSWGPEGRTPRGPAGESGGSVRRPARFGAGGQRVSLRGGCPPRGRARPARLGRGGAPRGGGHRHTTEGRCLDGMAFAQGRVCASQISVLCQVLEGDQTGPSGGALGHGRPPRRPVGAWVLQRCLPQARACGKASSRPRCRHSSEACSFSSV